MTSTRGRGGQQHEQTASESEYDDSVAREVSLVTSELSLLALRTLVVCLVFSLSNWWLSLCRFFFACLFNQSSFCGCRSNRSSISLVFRQSIIPDHRLAVQACVARPHSARDCCSATTTRTCILVIVLSSCVVIVFVCLFGCFVLRICCRRSSIVAWPLNTQQRIEQRRSSKSETAERAVEIFEESVVICLALLAFCAAIFTLRTHTDKHSKCNANTKRKNLTLKNTTSEIKIKTHAKTSQYPHIVPIAILSRRSPSDKGRSVGYWLASSWSCRRRSTSPTTSTSLGACTDAVCGCLWLFRTLVVCLRWLRWWTTVICCCKTEGSDLRHDWRRFTCRWSQL